MILEGIDLGAVGLISCMLHVACCMHQLHVEAAQPPLYSVYRPFTRNLRGIGVYAHFTRDLRRIYAGKLPCSNRA